MTKKTNKQLQQKNNIVLIYGNQHSVDDSIKKIKDQVKSDEVVKIDGDSIGLESLSVSLCCEDLFSRRKLILIKDIPKEDAKKLIELFQRIPENNFVVFYSYSSLKAKKTLCDYFSKYAKLIEYEMEISNMDKMISQIAKSNGKKINDDALSILTEYLGNNFGIVKIEIEKLCNYVGEKNEIYIDDVKEICCLSKDFMIWDLLGYIGERNITKSVESLSAAVENGCGYEFIVLMLIRSIKLGIFLRELCDSGLNVWEASDKIKECKKPDGSLIYKDYEIRKTYDSRTGFFANFSLWELCYCLKSCHEAFLSIRKLYKKEEQEKEMSMLLFAICFPSSFKN